MAEASNAVPADSGEAATGRKPQAFAGALLAVIIFGGSFVAGRQGALAGLGPIDLVALRYVVSGLIFLPILWRGGLKDLGGLGWPRGIVLTALAGAPYFFAVMLGLHYAPAAHGAVLNPGATPIAGLIFGLLLLGERPAAGVVIGLPLMLGGLVLVAGPAFQATGKDVWLGDVILIAAGIAYGLFTALLRRWRVPALRATAAIAVLSAVLWLPAYSMFADTAVLVRVPAVEVIGQAVFQGALVSGLAVFLYAHSVTVLGPARAGQFPALVPVVGTVLAALLLGEPLSLWQGAGVAAVCGGLFLAVWQPARRNKGKAHLP
ncbi:MAG TPA: DMT family transporter [Ferrovibrio sp.]|uniref:DMT family transporter n=1 Tax=Ferrovibrio sp. TaxID=1917215 RepID=UPI002ED00885